MTNPTPMTREPDWKRVLVSCGIAAAILCSIAAVVVLSVVTDGKALAVLAVMALFAALSRLAWSVLYSNCHCACAYCPYDTCPEHGR